jgi:hypothetical protein
MNAWLHTPADTTMTQTSDREQHHEFCSVCDMCNYIVQFHLPDGWADGVDATA